MRRSKEIFLVTTLLLFIYYLPVFAYSQSKNGNNGKIVIPSGYGEVKDRYDGKSGFTVIHIQDAHCVYEAQKNIATILESLVQNQGVALITVEGAADKIDASEYASFPDPKVRKLVTDYMMKQGRISGAEYFMITSGSQIMMTGLEDRLLYQKNLSQFQESLSFKIKCAEVFSRLKRIQKLLEEKYYPEEVKRMIELNENYTSGKLSLVDYVNSMFEIAGEKKIDTAGYENLCSIYKINCLEKDINFNVVESERQQLVNEISRRVSADQLRQLMQYNLQFKLQQISIEEFYNYLGSKMAEYGIDESGYVQLNRFRDYINIYKSLNWNEVLRESESLFDKLTGADFSGRVHGEIHQIGKNLDLLDQMYQFSLPVHKFADYLKIKDEIAPGKMYTQIKNISSDAGIEEELPDIKPLTDALPMVEEFYKTAKKRDDVLMQRLVNTMREQKVTEAVFIAGGFHTQGIVDFLKSNGISYQVVVPRITKIPQSTPYMSQITNRQGFYEMYLEKSALAVSSWLEKNPLSAPNRQYSFGYKMKSLMVGAYSYSASQEEPVLSRQDSEYLKQRVVAVLNSWGKQNYGNIDVTGISYIGPFLNVKMAVNGKEVVFLFTDREQDGKALFETPQGTTFEVLFNSAGEINMLEENNLGSFHFQVVTPKALRSLLSHSDALNNRSLTDIQEYIKQNMLYTLIEMLMEKQIDGPGQFEDMLRKNKLNLTEDDLAEFFREIGISSMAGIYTPQMNSTVANDSLLGAYLGVRSRHKSLLIDNSQLPSKAKDSFNRLGFKSIYIEQDVPVNLIRELFRKLSAREIDIFDKKNNRLYVGADKNGAYYLNVLEHVSGEKFLKIERLAGTSAEFSPKLDPNVVEKVVSSTAKQIEHMDVMPIHGSRVGVSYVSIKDKELTISIIEVDKKMKFFNTGLKVTINLKKNFNKIDLAFKAIQELAVNNDIILVGVMADVSNERFKRGYFPSVEDFINNYYTDLVRVEAETRFKERIKKPFTITDVQRASFGVKEKLNAIRISYQIDGVTYTEFSTDKLKKNKDENKFNLGLAEFFADRYRNMVSDPKEITSSEKLIITLNNQKYTLVREENTNLIRLLLRNGSYSVPIPDGEIEFIRASIPRLDRNAIDHIPGFVIPPSSTASQNAVFWDAWRKKTQPYQKDSVALLENDVVPFMSRLVYNYEDYLTKYFGGEITFLDLYGHQGAMVDRIMTRQMQHDTRMSINPYIIDSDQFDAAMAKKVLAKFDLKRERVISFGFASNVSRNISSILHNLQDQNQLAKPIVPHVISMVGSGLDYGITSYEDAYQLSSDVYKVMPNNGLLLVAGNDFLTLKAEDFEEIGFEVLETGNVESFFNTKVFPKQYYVLKKNKYKNSSAVLQSQKKDLPRIINEKKISKPAKDVFDLVAKLNAAEISLASQSENQVYKVTVIPKMKIERGDGAVVLSTDFTRDSISKSVDGKLYLEFYLSAPDRVSLLPVMTASVDLAMQDLNIDKITLDSVNFNGLIKDMRDIGFKNRVLSYIYQLFPDQSSIHVNTDLNYDIVTALFSTIPAEKRTEFDSLLIRIQKLQELIDKKQREGYNVSKRVEEINKFAAPLLKELFIMMQNPEILAQMNKNLLMVSELPPIDDYINAGYEKLEVKLSEDGKNIILTGRKTKPSFRVVAAGSLRSGLKSETGIEQDDEMTMIRQKLTQIEELLVDERIVSEGYFKAINFKIIDNAKTQILPSEIDGNTIVLDYKLFVKGVSSLDILLLEIKQGLMRLELQQIGSEKEIRSINQGVIELYLLLNYVQNFIDIREKDPDTYSGKSKQARILQMLDRGFGSEERPMFYLLRYVNEHNIKSAWLIKNILIDLITERGEFKGFKIYPESVSSELEKINPAALVEELNRIMELYDYRYIKRSVTISPTCISNLNLRAQKEKTVKQIVQSDDVQVVYLKVQNFKDVFNTFGTDIGVGHSFGDLGIFVIGRYLQETLEKRLAHSGIKVNMGNAGGEYFITFSNLKNVDVVRVLSDIFASPDSSFKEDVIREIKVSLKDQIGAAAYSKISDLVESEFKPSKLNFYAGVSEHEKNLQKETIPFSEKVSRAVIIADRLYAHAFQAAKHQQIQFSPTYNDVRANLAKLKSPLNENDRSSLEQMLKLAQKEPRTGIMLYTPTVAKEVSMNIKIGMANDYEFFQQSLAETYTWYNSIDILSVNYLASIEKKVGYEVLSELKDRILETVLLYKSRFLHEEYIYQGSDNFKRAINYIVNRQPDYEISRTFRLGGDEYGKIDWNPKTKNMRIYRLDGNNVGTTNMLWGKEIGDKLIDESLRIISETSDMSQLHKNITDFFNDMGERGLKLSENEVKDLQFKLVNSFLLDEDNYNLIKQNGTFYDFTKNNSAVIVRKKDGTYLLVKFPDINVPLLIQKAEQKFDVSALPFFADKDNAMPITLLAGEDVVDFVVVRDKTGGVIFESRNPRVPAKTVISQNDIENNTPIKIPVKGYGDIELSIKQDYGFRYILTAPIITLSEREFQRVKMMRDKLVVKDGKLAVIVKSRPVVSGGYIDIDTRKIDTEYLNRDISIIERRADSIGEEAKASVKLFQILHDGEVRSDYTLRESPNKFSGNKREMLSLRDIKPSNWDIMVARFILEEPKDKITRRLDYFLNKNIKLEANDIYVLAEIYFVSQNMLDYNQRLALLERLIDVYSLNRNERRDLIVNVLEQIFISNNKDLWVPAIDLYIKVLNDHDKSFDTISAFMQAISRVANNPVSGKIQDNWLSNPPVSIQDWIKSLIDLRREDLLSEMKTLSIPELNDLITIKAKSLPLAKQYRELFYSGRILESESLDQRHNFIMDSMFLIDSDKISKGYDFAYDKVKSKVSLMFTWNDVDQNDQKRITDILIGSRILEDSVYKMTGNKLDLGEIENIKIEMSGKTNIFDNFKISIEKSDGSVISGLIMNIINGIDKIQPDQYRKYFTSSSMFNYVGVMDQLHKTDPKLVDKVGGYYEFKSPDGDKYRVLMNREVTTLNSNKLISQAKQNLWGERLDHEIQDIVIKDIISYMRVWDVMGRKQSMFPKCPYPVNISAGNDIRNLEMLDSNVTPAEILDRLYKGYQQYNQDELIPNSIVEYFRKFDTEGENGGYNFLMHAYSQFLNYGKQKDFVARELNSYLKKRRAHLEEQIKSDSGLNYKELAQLIQLLRLTGIENKKSKYLNNALFWLEKFIINTQQTTLDYKLWKDTVSYVIAKSKGGLTDEKLLGDDMMRIFQSFGYNPMKELKETIVELRMVELRNADDDSLKEIIGKIEELEVIVGLKAEKDYTNVSDGGVTYEIHPYANPFQLPASHIGELGMEDSFKLINSALKKKIEDKSGKQVVISVTGRPFGGKEVFMRRLVTDGALASPNMIGIINIAEVRLPSGLLDIKKLEQRIEKLQNKQYLIIYGNEALILPEVTSRLKFDYNIFVESDEIERAKKLIASGKEKRVGKMRLENILSHWGRLNPEPGKTITESGLDSQRTLSDIVVNVSINGNSERTKRIWDPAVIVQNIKGLATPVKKILQVDLQTIKHVFYDKTVGKRVAFFEPVHNSEVISLAQMGMHVTVITNKKQDIGLSVEDEMRIKNSGGSIRVIWGGTDQLENLWVSEKFDLVYISKGSQVLNSENPLYSNSLSATINAFIKITKDDGVILLAPFDLHELFMKENMDDSIELQILSNGYSQVANLDGAAGVFLRKKNKSEKQSNNTIEDMKPVDVLNGDLIKAQEKRPMVIALDFDDILKYSGNWDLALSIAVIKQKQRTYAQQNIPVRFAFLSTEKTAREMRDLLMLRREDEQDMFIMLGREDIESENLFSAEPTFSIAMEKIINIVNNPLTNVIMLTASHKRINESANSRAIVIDTSTLVKGGVFVEEVIGVIGFLDLTLLQDKIDPTLMVSSVGENNPFYEKIGADSSGKLIPLQHFINDGSINYRDLRGIVIVAPRITNIPEKFHKKVQYSYLIDQSL